MLTCQMVISIISKGLRGNIYVDHDGYNVLTSLVDVTGLDLMG